MTIKQRDCFVNRLDIANIPSCIAKDRELFSCRRVEFRGGISADEKCGIREDRFGQMQNDSHAR